MWALLSWMIAAASQQSCLFPSDHSLAWSQEFRQRDVSKMQVKCKGKTSQLCAISFEVKMGACKGDTSQVTGSVSSLVSTSAHPTFSHSLPATAVSLVPLITLDTLELSSSTRTLAPWSHFFLSGVCAASTSKLGPLPHLCSALLMPHPGLRLHFLNLSSIHMLKWLTYCVYSLFFISHLYIISVSTGIFVLFADVFQTPRSGLAKWNETSKYIWMEFKSSKTGMTDIRKACTSHICVDSVTLKGIYVSHFLVTEMSM